MIEKACKACAIIPYYHSVKIAVACKKTPVIMRSFSPSHPMPAFFRSWHFITLIAVMTGLSALSIDAVLPAFPELTRAFALPAEQENRIQHMVFMFMLGFSIMQLAFGILTDIFGRKKLIIIGIAIYILASAATFFIHQYETLLIARFMQGAGIAAPRVISMAVVRDVSHGRDMSRILSFVTMVFLIIPALAPFIGQFMLMLGDWHSIFWLFILMGAGTLLWTALVLPETLPQDARRPFSLTGLKDAMRQIIRHRPTLICMIILGMMFSMMMTYISQAEQIFQRDVYALGDKFPIVFALVTLGMFTASMLNTRLVMKLGMQRVILAALAGMVAIDTLLMLATHSGGGKPPLAAFMLLLIAHLFCFGLIMPNLNSLILEPHQRIAGTVSALIGSLMSVLGIAIAQQIANRFNGTLYPFATGYLGIAVTALLAFIWVRKSKAYQD